MHTQILNLLQFADLLNLEAQKGIISGSAFIALVEQNLLPKIIRDIRGSVRMAVERVGNDFEVTQFSTDVSKEKLLKIR